MLKNAVFELCGFHPMVVFVLFSSHLGSVLGEGSYFISTLEECMACARRCYQCKCKEESTNHINFIVLRLRSYGIAIFFVWGHWMFPLLFVFQLGRLVGII